VSSFFKRCFNERRLRPPFLFVRIAVGEAGVRTAAHGFQPWVSSSIVTVSASGRAKESFLSPAEAGLQNGEHPFSHA